MMTGRERFLVALNNEKPDRMPCQVHFWMQSYLDKYIGGGDQYSAYEYFGMDPVIYEEPKFIYDKAKLAKEWQYEKRVLGTLEDGYYHWEDHFTTPEGKLVQKFACDEISRWTTEFLIKTPEDFELWKKYYPRPVGVDWSPIIKAKERIGNRGIVRGSFYDFGQSSPWQSFSSSLFGTEAAIFACYDDPDWVHSVLKHLLERKLEVIELGGKQELDLVECGGGGGSTTVISPALHEEFCLPYDKVQIKAFHDHGTKTVYHLCGGLMPLLETVVENGTDALETMTPPEMGGDCDLAEATRRVGHKLAFVGGFDQNNGFEMGTPETVRKMVHKLHAACPDGGYICSPSDHFFRGDPKNLKAFVEAARECVY